LTPTASPNQSKTDLERLSFYAWAVAAIEDGDGDLVAASLREYLEAVAEHEVRLLLDDIAANPPVMYDGVGVRVFAD
jgi:hypothetical protein